MRLFLTLGLFCLVAGLAQADPAAGLALAKVDFEKVQQGLSARVNRLDGELRTAIWTQYYYALERLRRMEVHQQMMLRHDKDRNVQFARAHAEFERAFGELKRLLPPTQDM